MLRASSCRNGIIGCNCRENGLIKVFGGIGMQLLGFVKQKKIDVCSSLGHCSNLRVETIGMHRWVAPGARERIHISSLDSSYMNLQETMGCWGGYTFQCSHPCMVTTCISYIVGSHLRKKTVGIYAVMIYAEYNWGGAPKRLCLDRKTQNFCKSFAWCTKCSKKINCITQIDCKSKDESNEPN